MGGRPLGTAGVVAQESIARRCATSAEPLALLADVARHVGSVIPYDAAGWLLTDPATLLHTGAHAERVPQSLHLRLIDNELTTPDFAKFADVAALARPVVRLRDATGGEPARSARHRTLYAPAGYGAEVRLAFRAGGACWGVACLARAEGEPELGARELAFLSGIVDDVGRGLRSALLAGRAAPAAGRPAPAVIVLDDDGLVRSRTGDAERYGTGLGDEGPGLPPVVHEIAALARARAATGTGPPPFARVRGRDGAWLVVHGARLEGTGAEPDRTVVTIAPASACDLLPLLLERFELTPRERQVTRLLVRGASTREIAGRLVISHHTVRDHVKAILGKAGVSSRAELAALLFHEEIPSGPAVDG